MNQLFTLENTPNGEAPGEWLTSAEAAALVPGGVTVRTVQRWARQGKVPSITLPSGLLRFRREDILALHEVVAS